MDVAEQEKPVSIGSPNALQFGFEFALDMHRSGVQRTFLRSSGKWPSRTVSEHVSLVARAAAATMRHRGYASLPRQSS